MFHHLVQGGEAAAKLLSLRQRSVSVYSIQFRSLDTDNGWNDTVLWGVYIKWLGEELKNDFAAQDKTPNLEILIALTMRLDNHLRQRQREKAV